MTSFKVIIKFGYNQVNISDRNVLLNNMSHASRFGGHKNIAIFPDLVFIINGKNLVVFL